MGKSRRPDGLLKAKRRAALRAFVDGASKAPGLTLGDFMFVNSLRFMAETDGAPLPTPEQTAQIDRIRQAIMRDPPERAVKRAALRAFLALASADPAFDAPEQDGIQALQHRYVSHDSGPMPSSHDYKIIGQMRNTVLRGFVRFASGDGALSVYEANFVNGMKQLAYAENGPLPSPKQCTIISQIRDKLRQVETAPEPDEMADDDLDATAEIDVWDWDGAITLDRLAQIEAEWTDLYPRE